MQPCVDRARTPSPPPRAAFLSHEPGLSDQPQAGSPPGRCREARKRLDEAVRSHGPPLRRQPHPEATFGLTNRPKGCLALLVVASPVRHRDAVARDHPGGPSRRRQQFDDDIGSNIACDCSRPPADLPVLLALVGSIIAGPRLAMASPPARRAGVVGCAQRTDPLAGEQPLGLELRRRERCAAA